MSRIRINIHYAFNYVDFVSLFNLFIYIYVAMNFNCGIFIYVKFRNARFIILSFR